MVEKRKKQKTTPIYDPDRIMLCLRDGQEITCNNDAQKNAVLDAGYRWTQDIVEVKGVEL